MSEPTAWTCPICGERYVVPSRAKDCEAKCREIVWVESGKANGFAHVVRNPALRSGFHAPALGFPSMGWDKFSPQAVQNYSETITREWLDDLP